MFSTLAVEWHEPMAEIIRVMNLLAFDLERLRRLGGSVLSAFPMLSGPRDGDPREL